MKKNCEIENRKKELKQGLPMLLLLGFIFLISFISPMSAQAQQLDEDKIAEQISDAFGIVIAAFESVITFFLDFGDPNSVVSQLWNLLPIVGNNALPQSIILYLAFGGGVLYISVKLKG